MPKKKKVKGLLPSARIRRSAYVGKREDGTKRYEYFIADTAAEADAMASQFRLRVKQLRAQGVRVEDIPRDIDQPVKPLYTTVGQAMDAFIETCRTQGYSPATIPAYKAIRNNSFPQIIDKPVDKITAQDVQAAINQRSEAHSVKTVRNDYFFIKRVLSIYRPDLSLVNIIIAKQKARRRQVFRQGWARDILKYAKEHECSDFYIYCAFIISAGLRPSEIYALTWDHISRQPMQKISKGKPYKVGVIDVRGAEVKDEFGKYAAKDTKTTAGNRTLTVGWAFFESIYAIKKPVDGERIVQLTPGGLKKRWHRVRQALGLPETMRFYDLRHYYATSVATSGATEDELAERMGHSTSAFSHAVYVELFDERQDDINAVLVETAEKTFKGL